MECGRDLLRYNGLQLRNKLEEHPDEEIYLFDLGLLNQIDWSSSDVQLKGILCPANPGTNLKVRPLSSGDFSRSYLNLLSQLTSIGDISEESFLKRFLSMKACPKTYYIIVVEDITLNKVVGTTSLIIEQKFIHGTSLRSRVEDVVVDELYRGQQIGKLLVQTAILLSKHLGCYKVSLECKEHNIKFYETFGFHVDQTYMVKRLNQ